MILVRDDRVSRERTVCIFPPILLRTEDIHMYAWPGGDIILDLWYIISVKGCYTSIFVFLGGGGSLGSSGIFGRIDNAASKLKGPGFLSICFLTSFRYDVAHSQFCGIPRKLRGISWSMTSWGGYPSSTNTLPWIVTIGGASTKDI